MRSKAVIYTPLIILFVLIAIVLFAAIKEGLFSEKEYLKPWNKGYYKNFSDPRVQLIAHGILAANGHNMQNWKFVLSDENNMAFDMYIEKERLATNVDPFHTQAMISQGTAFEYMDIAGKELGYKTDIILFPDGELTKDAKVDEINTSRIARVILSKENDYGTLLYDQIFKPDTNRLKYKTEQLSEDIIKDFSDNNTFDNLDLVYISPSGDRYELLKSLISDSVTVETSVGRIMNESSNIFRPNEKEKNKYRYGFSFEGSSITPLKKHILQSMLTLFPSINNLEANKKSFIDQTKLAIENNSGFILIKAKSNTRENQFNSGRLYSRLQLLAHTYNLAVQPLSQPIEEYSEMEQIFKSIHFEFANEGEQIMMLFRIGEPEKNASQTMRKDVLDFIK